MNQSEGSIASFEVAINDFRKYVRNEKGSRPLHEVEADLLAHVRRLGRAALADIVERTGTGDVGPVHVDHEGRMRRRHAVRQLTYRSLFGPIAIARMYYFDPLHGGIAPHDAQLALPGRGYSYVLQGMVTRLAAIDAYDTGLATLEALLGISVPKSMVEAIVAESAVDVRAFQTALPAPAGEGSVLVVQLDGKGVPMVHPKAPVVPGPKIRKKTAARRGIKKMATVATLYTMNPEPGCPPVPLNRKTYAFLGTKREAFAWVAAEAAKRGYGSKTTLFLSDGDPDLAALQLELLPEALPCLDFVHLTEYLWDAAYVFHKEGSPEAHARVKELQGRLLSGDVVTVLRGLRQSLTKGEKRLAAAKKETLERAIGYIENNKARVPYAAFMLAGYPIGTGCVEGACRHHVADRMEGTGMHWKPPGAQAVLHMRSVVLNDELDEFTAHRIKQEQNRKYGTNSRFQAAA